MRNATNINFSLIIPTRDRLELLRENIASFYRLAQYPNQVETIVVTDFDDPANHEILDLLPNFPNAFLISQKRTSCLIKDYNNRGSQLSTGKYVWILNDECEIITKHWDQILIHRIETFLHHKHDRILYVVINDDTHYNAGVIFEAGCCFPILTREAVDCLNGIMPPEINAHGADYETYHIFKKLVRPRILNCCEVALIDHSSNNHYGTYKHKRKSPDKTQKEIDRNSAVTQLTEEQRQYYNNLLSNKILSVSPHH